MAKDTISNMNMVWIASYPRSGNTFLRTILWHCFGLRSASLYRNDLGGNHALEEYIGHIEHGPDGKIPFPENTIQLVKTHGYPVDENPAIYVLRDGRAATASLWDFDLGNTQLNTIIEGHHRFGSWSDHIRAWKPDSRPNTLLLKYEDMKIDLPATVESISLFLDRRILSAHIPDRGTIANTDGRWVRNVNTRKNGLPKEALGRFNELNETMLRKMGYKN